MYFFNLVNGDVKMTETTIWEKRLEQVLDRIYKKCLENNVKYYIVGSISTALQGCKIEPKDIDILADTPEGVVFITKLLKEFELPEKVQTDNFEEWHSSNEQPIFINEEPGEIWHSGKWMIDDFKVEVAYYHSESSMKKAEERGCMWENGPEIRSYAREVDFQGFKINVIPLEMQLCTNMFRKIEKRITETVRIFKEQGYNDKLLKKALTNDQYSEIKALLEMDSMLF